MNEKNQIILDRSVMAALYKNVLIEPAHDKTTTPSKTPVKKNKEIRVVTTSKTGELPQSQATFLEAILKACHVQMQDIELVCISATTSAEDNRSPDVVFTKTLMFGVTPEQLSLPVRFPHFQIQSFEKTVYLSAPDLTTIEEDKQLKATLWHCLQKIFL